MRAALRRIVDSGTLRSFSASVLQAGGFAPDHAAQTADLLVWANLRGADSHGVLRIPRYVEMVQLGIINPKPQLRFVSEFGATAVLDADRAPGAVGMIMADVDSRVGGAGGGRIACRSRTPARWATLLIRLRGPD